MIIPDVNLLVYAYTSDSINHKSAKIWFEKVVSSNELIGIPWIVALSFLRLMTHRSVLKVPMEAESCYKIVESWYKQDNVEIVEAGPNITGIIQKLVKSTKPSGNLFYDLFLAALAIDNRATIYTNDSDFSRFKGVNWKNPL